MKRLKIVRDREYPTYLDDWGASLSLTSGTLAGRGSASGTGRAQQITLGAGLSMAGKVLSASGSGASGNSFLAVGAATTAAYVTLASWTGTNIMQGGMYLANTGLQTLSFKLRLFDMVAFENNLDGTILSGGNLIGDFSSFVTSPLLSVLIAVKSTVAALPTTYDAQLNAITG